MKRTELEAKQYPFLAQGLYRAKLPNGLTVHLLPKEDYHETYGVLTVSFGSLDQTFKLEGQKEFVTYPAGIAHFLEHKLFERGDGVDILQEFSKLGAHANAYTGFSQTSYLFSTAEEVLPALELLQNFVGQTAFSEESVEKEKAIIAQEIEMYEDDPDSRLYNEILASLYPHSPLENDIAGSRVSIQDITVQFLEENFQAFYQPSQMHLFLVGSFDLESAWQQIQGLQAKKESSNLQVQGLPLPHHPVKGHAYIQMEVASPKLAIGIRGTGQLTEESLQRYRLSLSLFFSMLFGRMSSRYQRLYEEGKIDTSFSHHLEVKPDYHYFVMTMDTKEPIALSSRLRKAIQKFETDPDLTEDHLDMLKKKTYGDFIRSLNSLEFTASHFVQHLSDQENIFDLPEMLREIDLAEVVEAGRQFLANCDMTDFVIFPK